MPKMFQDKYNKIVQIIYKDLEKINLSDNLNIEEPLKTKLSNILNAPSKHIRPLLSFLYLKSMGFEINDEQILYQKSIELLHNASLIHDDIIDESDLRRNKTTINKDYDGKLAVISGDYVLSIAINNLLKIGKIELVKLFSETTEEMTKGEISQYFERFEIPTLENYLKKTEQKTAKLFETSLLGSLKIAGIENPNANFAKYFGIAFQIRDDIINCQTTKSDIKEGIYTAPVIFSEGVEVTQIGLEKTRSLLNNYLDKAQEEIKNIENNKYKQALSELLELFRYE